VTVVRRIQGARVLAQALRVRHERITAMGVIDRSFVQVGQIERSAVSGPRCETPQWITVIVPGADSLSAVLSAVIFAGTLGGAWSLGFWAAVSVTKIGVAEGRTVSLDVTRTHRKGVVVA
jgi:hypothetical protein